MPFGAGPYFARNSSLPSQVVKGTCVSFISKIPLFFMSIWEASTTILSNLSTAKAPAREGQSMFFQQGTVGHLPSSIKSFSLVGVPTAMPVLVDFRNLIESESLMCFAKSLATVASLVWNFLMTLPGISVLC